MNPIWLALLTLVITNPLVGQSFKTVRLNEFAKVDFPDVPEIEKVLDFTYFIHSGSDAIYMVVINEALLKNNDISQNLDLPNWYERYFEGTLDAAKGKLISKTELKIDGFKAVEIKYSSEASPLLPKVRYKLALFLNGVHLSFDYWPIKENRKSVSNKNRFYESITISCDNCSQ